MGDYEILENISANVTLVQLMDSLGNVNHAISVVGNCIFDSNYEKALVLNRASLDMICDHSVGEFRVHYNLIKYRKKGEYNILEDISANVTLVQLMDSLGNVNHDISVVGNWIFDSNYERALVLNRASLYMICAPSAGEEQTARFDKVYYAVRYILNEEKLKIR